MFNMLNARKIEDEYNVFAGIFNSNIFWSIWVFIVGCQVWQHAAACPLQMGLHSTQQLAWF